MRLSPQEVYELARRTGFPDAPARLVVAIAQRESSFDPMAFNPVAPDLSYGLMQINMYGRLGPARRAAWGLTSNEDLYAPDVNMRAAFSLWNGNDANFRHWSTYAAARSSELSLPDFAAGAGSVLASSQKKKSGGKVTRS